MMSKTEIARTTFAKNIKLNFIETNIIGIRMRKETNKFMYYLFHYYYKKYHFDYGLSLVDPTKLRIISLRYTPMLFTKNNKELVLCYSSPWIVEIDYDDLVQAFSKLHLQFSHHLQNVLPDDFSLSYISARIFLQVTGRCDADVIIYFECLWSSFFFHSL